MPWPLGIAGSSFVPAAGGGEIAVEQSAGNQITASETASLTISFSSTPSTGNLVVVALKVLAGNQDLGTISASDNQGNTYTSRLQYDATARVKHAYFTTPITTASGTFTVTCAVANMETWASVTMVAAILEVSGEDSASLIEQTATASDTGTTASVTLGAVSETSLNVCMAQQSFDVSIAEAAGWTEIYNPDNFTSVVWRIGDYDPSWTLGLSGDWRASGIAINAE